jgi:hypothetical protein
MRRIPKHQAKTDIKNLPESAINEAVRLGYNADAKENANRSLRTPGYFNPRRYGQAGKM